MLKGKTNYRNKLDFVTTYQEVIDAGSLWELKEQKLILVDEDNYVETDLDLNLFEPS